MFINSHPSPPLFRIHHTPTWTCPRRPGLCLFRCPDRFSPRCQPLPGGLTLPDPPPAAPPMTPERPRDLSCPLSLPPVVPPCESACPCRRPRTPLPWPWQARGHTPEAQTRPGCHWAAALCQALPQHDQLRGLARRVHALEGPGGASEPVATPPITHTQASCARRPPPQPAATSGTATNQV